MYSDVSVLLSKKLSSSKTEYGKVATFVFFVFFLFASFVECLTLIT